MYVIVYYAMFCHEGPFKNIIDESEYDSQAIQLKKLLDAMWEIRSSWTDVADQLFSDGTRGVRAVM